MQRQHSKGLVKMSGAADWSPEAASIQVCVLPALTEGNALVVFCLAAEGFMHCFPWGGRPLGQVVQ